MSISKQVSSSHKQKISALSRRSMNSMRNSDEKKKKNSKIWEKIRRFWLIWWRTSSRSQKQSRNTVLWLNRDSLIKSHLWKNWNQSKEFWDARIFWNSTCPCPSTTKSICSRSSQRYSVLNSLTSVQPRRQTLTSSNDSTTKSLVPEVSRWLLGPDLCLPILTLLRFLCLWIPTLAIFSNLSNFLVHVFISQVVSFLTLTRFLIGSSNFQKTQLSRLMRKDLKIMFSSPTKPKKLEKKLKELDSKYSFQTGKNQRMKLASEEILWRGWRIMSIDQL